MTAIEEIPTQEGRIPFHGHETWYRIFGERQDPEKQPVLALHGGPGAAHDYLEPIGGLARSGRQVIMYDQLGCGNSAVPSNPSMWTVNLFVEEVDAVRRALGLNRVHVLGQSWGGMLAMQYALTQPSGLTSLVVADSPASIPFWLQELGRLREQLPPEVEQTLRKHEAAGTFDNPEYEEAVDVFYRRHLCRVDPYPEPFVRSFAKLAANPEVYHTMNGPSEFHVIGVIKDWDISDRLGEINVPTLLISGGHDEVTPATVEMVHRGIPGSEWVLFEESAHVPHLEETERFLTLVEGFLDRVEGMHQTAIPETRA
jgi:proline-specific peptidase